VHEVHASAARLGSETRQQRDEQRRQRERQHLEFLVHQRESHEVHGRLQRHRTVEAQREAMRALHWQNWTPLISKGLVYWGKGRNGYLRLKMRPHFFAVRAIIEKEQNDAG
jgi:hypothetical protein